MACHRAKALSDALGPSQAADQWIIQHASFKRPIAGHVAELHHFQQHRGLRKIRDNDFNFGSRLAPQLDVQLWSPFSFELLACQRQSFVRCFHLTQRGPRQHQAEHAGDNGSDHRNVIDQGGNYGTVVAEPSGHRRQSTCIYASYPRCA